MTRRAPAGRTRRRAARGGSRALAGTLVPVRPLTGTPMRRPARCRSTSTDMPEAPRPAAQQVGVGLRVRTRAARVSVPLLAWASTKAISAASRASCDPAVGRRMSSGTSAGPAAPAPWMAIARGAGETRQQGMQAPVEVRVRSRRAACRCRRRRCCSRARFPVPVRLRGVACRASTICSSWASASAPAPRRLGKMLAAAFPLGIERVARLEFEQVVGNLLAGGEQAGRFAPPAVRSGYRRRRPARAPSSAAPGSPLSPPAPGARLPPRAAARAPSSSARSAASPWW